MEVITHFKRGTNIGKTERFVSAAAGSALAIIGLEKRSPIGIALAAIGGDLIRRGVTGHSLLYEMLGVRTADLGQGGATTSVPYELGIRVDESITVGKPRPEVFQFWRNLQNLPRFMKHLESVRVEGDRSHWVACAPAGKTVEWDAVIHSEVENERIAWRSLPGADVDNAGSVIFTDAPAHRGTLVRVELQYNPPGGTLGALLAKIWGREPSQQVKEDLRRFKQIMEVGEILTTEGQPSGRAVEETHADRRRKDQVQSASEESFPASDAPSYTASQSRQEVLS
ncbi:MAG: SRPBCC family protein [Bryobacteraceae bacterium]